jgi:hypothetical protein
MVVSDEQVLGRLCSYSNESLLPQKKLIKRKYYPKMHYLNEKIK